MENSCKILQAIKPILFMIIVEACLSMVNIFYKLATRDGMDMRIIVTYRFLFATLFISPIAFFVERNKRPPLTKKIIFQAFITGLLGATIVQNFYIQSLSYTSATYAAAMSNLGPAITFILAVTLRLEKFRWETFAGKAKLFGTITCMSGAMLLTYFHGPEIKLPDVHLNIFPPTHGSYRPRASNPVLGSLLALGAISSSSCYLIVQGKIAQKFRCPLTSTAMMSGMAFLQCLVYALCFERRLEEWKLDFGVRLLAVSFTGIVAFGMTFSLIATVVQMRGPLYVSVFHPLKLLFVAIGGYVLVSEKVYVGVVIGSSIIVGGLYLVLLGKAKEMKATPELVESNSSKGSRRITVISVSSDNIENIDDHEDTDEHSKRTLALP